MKTIGKKTREWFPTKSEADAYLCALQLMNYADAELKHTDSGWWVERGDKA